MLQRSCRVASCLFSYGSPDRSDLHSFPTRRSSDLQLAAQRPLPIQRLGRRPPREAEVDAAHLRTKARVRVCTVRSEEHTSELQSHSDLVCRLLLEKKTHSCKNTRQCASAQGSHRIS